MQKHKFFLVNTNPAHKHKAVNNSQHLSSNVSISPQRSKLKPKKGQDVVLIYALLNTTVDS